MIYEPSDDSHLIEEQVKVYSKNKKVLDLGSGGGILALAAIKSGAKSVTASDINNEAIKELKKQEIKAIQSNLFEKVKGKFDLIVFNPPYLPEDKEEDKESAMITTGGEKGDEIIIEFLKQSVRHLDKDGIILLLLSSLTPRKRIDGFMKELGLKSEIISSKKLFFEELFVLKINKISN